MSGSGLSTLLQSIAANVLACRVRRGWTQQDLAEAAELDVRHLQRIERATINIRVGVLLALANALNVPPVRLFRPAALPPAKAGRPSRKARVLRRSRTVSV